MASKRRDLKVAKGAQQNSSTERIEDYLEAIHDLITEKGYATMADISTNLRVRPPTVTDMLQKLDRKGFVIYEKYRGIVLTPRGARIARSVVHRHEIILRFLKILGVEKNAAFVDTEGIEHHVQPTTIDKIAKLVRFMERNPVWMQRFKRFAKSAA